MSHNPNQASSGDLDSVIPKIQHLDMNANPQSSTEDSTTEKAATDGIPECNPFDPFNTHNFEACDNFNEDTTCEACLFHYKVRYLSCEAIQNRVAPAVNEAVTAATDRALKDAMLELKVGDDILEELRLELGEKWYEQQCNKWGETEKERMEKRQQAAKQRDVRKTVNTAAYRSFVKTEEAKVRDEADVNAILRIINTMPSSHHTIEIRKVVENIRKEDLKKSRVEAFERFRTEVFGKSQREYNEYWGQDEEMGGDNEEGMLVDTKDGMDGGDNEGGEGENVGYDRNDENMGGV